MQARVAEPRFQPAIDLIRGLERHPRYLGAFIFGSVAEGTATKSSDLDAKVVVDVDNACPNVNHPHVGGIKLDLSFSSLNQLEAHAQSELAEGWGRSPNLATALILFDKTGKLAAMQQRAAAKRPPTYAKKDYQWAQFMLYHANDKVQRALGDDLFASLYSMHANIGEVLKIHYQLNGKWWVSSKKVLADLDSWDAPLAEVLRRFVATSEVNEKFNHWTSIVDYVAGPMGGRTPIQENNCDCAVCQTDLAALLAA